MEMFTVKFRRDSKDRYWSVKEQLSEVTLDIAINRLKDLFRLVDEKRIEIVIERVGES